MSQKTPENVTACVLGLCGFSVSAVAGLAAGAGATDVIIRALIAMFICYVIGSFLGAIGMIAVREHLDQYRTENPIPEPFQPGETDPSAQQEPGAEPAP